jgi:histidinol-phosphate aminotransferase
VYDATDGIVVVDEAYAEFAPDGAPTALSLLPGRPRLLVSRTMSKAFAFAGARVGYLAADPAVTDALRLVRLPYHLSALTQAAAIAALAHTAEMLAMVDDIRQQRDRLVTELAALGYQPHRSGSNFVLFGGVDDPNATFEALLAEGVLIRDVGIPGNLRVTAGTEAETTAFLEALARVTRAAAE